MEGKWKIFLVMLGLLVCFGLVYVIMGNGKQSSPEQIKKAFIPPAKGRPKTSSAD